MTVDVAPNEAIPLTVADGVDAGVASFPPKRSLDRGLFLYLPFAFTAALTFAMQTDDPFITLRYAWNLVHGHGPVFNMGERVQGYTQYRSVKVTMM